MTRTRTVTRAAVLLTAALLLGAGPAAGQESFDAAMARGAAALQGGRIEEARAAFTAALELRPGHPAAQALLGNALLAAGDTAAATELLEVAAGAAADYYPARLGLGRAYLASGRIGPAIEQLNAAANLDPSDVASRMLLAQALLQQDRAAEAAGAATELTRLAPDEFGAHYLLATAELRSRNAAAALPEFETALQLRPDDAGAQYGRAIALRSLDRDQDARAALSQLLEQHPDHAEAWMLLGEIAATAATTFDGSLMAAEFYQEGLRLRPEAPRATLALARLYLRLGLFGSGRALFADLPATVTDTPEAQNLIGRLAAGEREYDAAAAAHRRAIELGGGAEAWYRLGVAQFNLDDPESEASFARAAQLQPDYGAAWRELGKVRLDANEAAAANEALDHAATLLPEDAETHYLRGMARLRAGEVDAATAELERAVQLDPAHTEAKYNLALALRRRGETTRSAALLSEVQEARREADPGAAGARRRRGLLIMRQGYARYRLGEPDTALALLGQAAELVQDNDLVYLYRGLALAELQRFDEAIAALEQAASLDDDRPETWQALAQLYARVGRTQEAQQAKARLQALARQEPPGRRR